MALRLPAESGKCTAVGVTRSSPSSVQVAARRASRGGERGMFRSFTLFTSGQGTGAGCTPLSIEDCRYFACA